MNTPYTTIIIDDEPPARKGLQDLLEGFTETFNIIATAKNGTEAVQKINQLTPDVIFLDIEMPGLTGFEVLEKLEKLPIVVFCTAYDQYALQAFETNSIDYLVKPVEPERIEKTVKKLNAFSKNPITPNVLALLKQVATQKEVKKMTSITVKKKDKLIFIKLEDIAYFEADNNYTVIYSEIGNYLTEQTITSLEVKLPDYFLRVHRGIIVNTNYVKEVQKYFNSRFVFSLNNKAKDKITSGRSYTAKIKNWMQV